MVPTLLRDRRSPVVLGVAALATTAGLVVSGCSQPTDQAREAGNLGTRVCVTNQSSAVPQVGFTLKDTARGEGSLVTGAQACGEGTMGGGKNDVEGTITVDAPGKSMKFSGNNPWFGAPGTVLGQVGGNFCAGSGSMSIGEARVWDDGVLRYTVSRLADGQWKEFTITIDDTQKPSADGQPAACPAGPGAAPAS